MAPWLAVLEAYAVQALLRTPGFHRAVEKVAKNVHRIRHGLPPEEQGGTSIDRLGESNFGQHFIEELRTQLGRAESSEQKNSILKEAAKGVKEEMDEGAEAAWRDIQKTTATKGKKVDVEVDESAESAWRNMQKSAAQPPKQGFMTEYMDALRSQIRDGKPPR